ncbi:hypothetical protein MG293_002312 [Ovis ammon polii]|uniref:Uncharacterized protein n=1 Tax=Ovis ammon polii TaxID=230172 RepID=A0AAD4YFV4_OVIAM|nr:hypothetical protein MG293_002312 [Ovis ammon polii]
MQLPPDSQRVTLNLVGDEGRRRSVLPSSSVTGEGNTRERQGKGPQPNRAGPVPTGQSEGGAQEAQHRHLKTPGPWRVAPTGSLRTADHAEGGPQLPSVVRGSTVNGKAANGKQTQNTGTFLQDNRPCFFKNSTSRVRKPDCGSAAERHEDYHSLPPRPHCRGEHGPLPLLSPSGGGGGMQLAGPWVLGQGLNLGPHRQRVDVPSANRWTAFSEKRMLSGDLLRPPSAPSEPESTDKGRAPALQLRAGAAAPGRAPNLPPSLQDTHTGLQPEPRAPGHSSGTSATPWPGGLVLGRGSLPTKATSADLVPTESEPHLLSVQSHG